MNSLNLELKIFDWTGDLLAFPSDNARTLDIVH